MALPDEVTDNLALSGLYDGVATVQHVELGRFLPPALAVSLDPIEIYSLLVVDYNLVGPRLVKQSYQGLYAVALMEDCLETNLGGHLVRV